MTVTTKMPPSMSYSSYVWRVFLGLVPSHPCSKAACTARREAESMDLAEPGIGVRLSPKPRPGQSPEGASAGEQLAPRPHPRNLGLLALPSYQSKKGASIVPAKTARNPSLKAVTCTLSKGHSEPGQASQQEKYQSGVIPA